MNPFDDVISETVYQIVGDVSTVVWIEFIVEAKMILIMTIKYNSVYVIELNELNWIEDMNLYMYSKISIESIR